MRFSASPRRPDASQMRHEFVAYRHRSEHPSGSPSSFAPPPASGRSRAPIVPSSWPANLPTKKERLALKPVLEQRESTILGGVIVVGHDVRRLLRHGCLLVAQKSPLLRRCSREQA